MSRTAIETYTGGFFEYGQPDHGDIYIEDIARSLSMTCRFRGHVSSFYSVAEHSVKVRQLVIEAGHPDLGLAALLHDAHEAYVGDVPTPLKNKIGDKLALLVDDIDIAICEALDVRAELHHAVVLAADAMCLRHEAAVLKRSRGTGPHWDFDHPAVREGFVDGWSPAQAEERFLAAWRKETA